MDDWPLIIFHNIIDVSSYNAFVIWNKINPTWMPDKRNKRRVFLEQLGKALVTPHIQRRDRLPRTAAPVKAVQGAESCPDPPEAAAGAGKRRRFCHPKENCKTNTYVLHMYFSHLQSPHTHLHTALHSQSILIPVCCSHMLQEGQHCSCSQES